MQSYWSATGSSGFQSDERPCEFYEFTGPGEPNFSKSGRRSRLTHLTFPMQSILALIGATGSVWSETRYGQHSGRLPVAAAPSRGNEIGGAEPVRGCSGCSVQNHRRNECGDESVQTRPNESRPFHAICDFLPNCDWQQQLLLRRAVSKLRVGSVRYSWPRSQCATRSLLAGAEEH